MCGIAGMFGRGDVETARIMLDRLYHRGPDDGHLASGRDYVLGARRLSIVDLAGGRQPMSNEDGTVWAAQNGELYNYPEERPVLEARGHHFATHCDTELIPHLYEDHSTDLARRLDGMFAICLWDQRQQRGLLIRDRTGKKPLYYYQSGDCLYFASEIKSLLCVPGFERRIDRTALHHYLGLKHVPAPLSIFQGVRMLPPAHILVYQAGSISVQRYWRPDFSGGESVSEEEAVERFLAHFKNAVRRRLMADVPIGFFLSGGLDSSLTTAVAAEICPGQVKTFTLTYAHEAGNTGKDEDRRWARFVAEKYRTEHHEEVIEFGDFPSQLRSILGHFDEPFAGVVSTYYLSRLIRKHVKVAVSGDGADELFGSYLSHRLAFPLANFEEYRRTGDSRLIQPFANDVGRLESLHGLEEADWRSKLLTFSDDERRTLYTEEFATELGEARTSELWHDAFRSATARDPLNRVLETEFLTIFPDQVLAFVDRLSMAHSLEVRTAFLDTRLVEFVAALPGRFKIKDGQTKYLLKRAAERYFPAEMVHRKKEGFLMPITQWLMRNLRDYVHDTLHPVRLRRHGLFRPEAVERLVARVYAGDADYAMVNKLYALLVFQEWHELYFGAGELSAVAPRAA